MRAIIKNFKLDARKLAGDADAQAIPLVLKHFGIRPEKLTGGMIVSRSIDSRRGGPHLVYTLLLELADDVKCPLPPATEEELAKLAPPQLELAESPLRHPVVIGTGPAGIFGALALALAGCRPVILDRGAPVEERLADHERFLRTRELDEESNLLIGEGGAGTFSDGKLYTGTRDPRGRFVIEALIEAGAPANIRFHARPHVGSDHLRRTCAALRKRIVELGGEFRFHSRVADLTANGASVKVHLGSGGILDAPAVLLAPGLGGRELVRSLGKKYGGAVLKPFQIGCRIEHPQQFVDFCQYHGSRPECLEAAEYHISGGGVSSFCMCPGGTIVNASAWKDRSCTNGMSLRARDGEFANAALISTLPPELFGSPDDAYALIERIEAGMFRLGGSDYTFPAQDASAFIAGKKRLSRTGGSAETGYTAGRIDELLPVSFRDALRGALVDFDRRMHGFIRHGVFVGAESCVSSPLRLLRDECGAWCGMPHVFPAGEGVGAAGGIVSAACDGIRSAEAMMKNCRSES